MAVDVRHTCTARLAIVQTKLRQRRLRLYVTAWRRAAQHQLTQHQRLQQMLGWRRQRLLRLLLGVWRQRCEAWATRRQQQQAAAQHWAVRVLRRSLMCWQRHFR